MDIASPLQLPKGKRVQVAPMVQKATKAFVTRGGARNSDGVAVFAKWAPATGLFYWRYSGLDVFGEREDNGV